MYRPTAEIQAESGFPDAGHPGYPVEPGEPDTDDPRPWYQRPAMLIGWLLAVLILLAVIGYGAKQLFGGDDDTGPAPTTTSTTRATTTVTETPTTETTTTPSTEATTAAPSTAATEAPPVNPPGSQPAQTTNKPSPGFRLPDLPELPPIPSTITIPNGPTITLPPNLPSLGQAYRQ